VTYIGMASGVVARLYSNSWPLKDQLQRILPGCTTRKSTSPMENALLYCGFHSGVKLKALLRSRRFGVGG